MFLTSGLFPDILYAFNSILAGVITGVFLLASLMQTGRLRKAVYVSCGIVSLILISPIAVYYSFGKPAVCLLAGTLAAFFFWSALCYKRLCRQNRELLFCLLALLLMLAQLSVTWLPVFLPDILSFFSITNWRFRVRQ